jgi:hypothetical protein
VNVRGDRNGLVSEAFIGSAWRAAEVGSLVGLRIDRNSSPGRSPIPVTAWQAMFSVLGRPARHGREAAALAWARRRRDRRRSEP